MSDEREARMALGVLVEPGSRELGLLVRAEGAPVALDCVLRGVGVTDQLAGAVRARLASAGLAGAPDVVARIVEGMTERADRLGARIVTAADDEWPAALDDLVSASREGNMLR